MLVKRIAVFLLLFIKHKIKQNKKVVINDTTQRKHLMKIWGIQPLRILLKGVFFFSQKESPLESKEPNF